MTFGGSAIAWGAVASPFVFVSTHRHFPDTEVVGRDLPSLGGPRQRNSIAADSLTAKTARCSAPLGRNSLLCVHQGVPLPSSAVASDLNLPVTLVRAAPAVGRSASGFPGTSVAAPRPRPSERSCSGRGSRPWRRS